VLVSDVLFLLATLDVLCVVHEVEEEIFYRDRHSNARALFSCGMEVDMVHVEVEDLHNVGEEGHIFLVEADHRTSWVVGTVRIVEVDMD
jgi:hypothetical protein